MSFPVPQPHSEPGDVAGEVCCTCGLRGRQCVHVATCWHFNRITERGYVYAPLHAKATTQSEEG